MRTTKVMAFSVPSAFESIIVKSAKNEHRTVSEFLREAVRQYLKLQAFETTRTAVAKRMKKMGVKPSDVDAVLRDIRKQA